LTGPLIRLSSGLRAVSEVTVIALTVVVEPSPVLTAGTGNAYGPLGTTLPVSTGVPWPVVTEMSFLRVHRPRVLPTGLLLPFAKNGTEFTRYSVPVPVPIAGSSPTTGLPARETGPSTVSLSVASSATSCALEIARTIAPS
jgi:hypothetical protein